MHTDHSVLKYLVNKPMLGGENFQMALIVPRIQFEVIVKPGRLNAGPHHLPRIQIGEEPTNLEDELRDVQLFVVHVTDGHFEDIIHFLTIGIALEGYFVQQKKELVVCMADFSLIVGNLYKMGTDEILQRYVPKF